MIILFFHFLCPILFTHILFYHSDISIQFYSIVLYSTLVGLTEATIGSILVISVLLNMFEVHDSGNALKNPEPWLGNYRWQRFWIDGGPLRKEKWFTFPVFIITTLPAFNEPAARQRIQALKVPPCPPTTLLPRDQSFLHMLIIMRFQLKHDLIVVIMDLRVEEVFLSGVDAPHAQRAHGRFTKVPFNCWNFQGHTHTQKVYQPRLGEPILRF